MYAFSLFTGCGANLEPQAPQIRLFQFLSQDVSNPQLFNFKIDWQDAEGDLFSASNPGKLILKIELPEKPNETPKEVLYKLKKGRIEGRVPILAPDLKVNAKTGTIPQIILELKEDSGNYPNQIKITATLIDSQGHKSNKPWLIIQKKTL